MITLTDLKGHPLDLDIGLVEMIKRAPDTFLLLQDGRTLIVRESIEEVLARFQRRYSPWRTMLRGVHID